MLFCGKTAKYILYLYAIFPFLATFVTEIFEGMTKKALPAESVQNERASWLKVCAAESYQGA